MKDQLLSTDDVSLRQKVADLLSLQLFNKDVIDTIYANTRVRSFEEGEEIIREGEVNTWIYFILSGNVRLVRNRREIMRLRRYGDIIGLLSFIDEKPHPFAAIAGKDTQCLAMDSSLMSALEVNNHMDFHYIVNRIFTETLAEHLRMAINDL